ncbi:MAG: hypothetical protein Kow0059_02590 [Candidatus Sumerlaeia bacterium]
MIDIQITTVEFEPLPARCGRTDCGAELVFHGVVRDSEGGEPITALFYEHYPGMAEKELRRLADEAVMRFGLDDLICHHRVGVVPAGEASLRVVMRARHRGAVLDAMAWFISALKRDVPIWKWGVRADGSRFPSQGGG